MQIILNNDWEVEEFILTDEEKAEIALAESLSKNGEDRWLYHFYYGVTSKFPLCCVLHYCDVDDSLTKSVGDEYKEGKISGGYDMIKCPECLIRYMEKYARRSGSR